MEVAKTETVVTRYDSQGRVLDRTTTIVENGDTHEETTVPTGLYL